jgi:hypothetical protein
MHKIQITFVPTPEPKGDIIPMALSSRVNSWEFIIAKRKDDRFIYEHKPIFEKKGTVLQVLSRDDNGFVSLALPENAFDIRDYALKMTLIDTYDDGSEYKLRIEVDTIKDPKSKTVLSNLYNPQIRIAEVTYLQDNNIITELEFIGAEDIRMGFAARVLRRPNETFTISNEKGDIVFNY